jgi:hypothetical protein
MNPSSAIAASEFNNKGVYLLENGMYSQAVVAFSQGMVLVKQVLAEEEEDEKVLVVRVASAAQACSESASLPECFFHQLQGTQPSSEYPQDAFSCEEPFLFKAPIYIHSTDTTATGFASTKYYIKSSFILLYNLALAHHLRAVTEPKPNKRLKRAMQLYEIAYTMQLQDLDLSVLQVMAISNNLGHIHTILRNETKSRQCFEHLLQSILLCQHPQEEDELVVSLDGFLTNVMPFMLTGLASAPAA